MIQNEVEDVLSDGLLSGQIHDNNRVRIDLDADGKLSFTPSEQVTASAGDIAIKPIDTSSGNGGNGDGGVLEKAVI